MSEQARRNKAARNREDFERIADEAVRDAADTKARLFAFVRGGEEAISEGGLMPLPALHMFNALLSATARLDVETVFDNHKAYLTEENQFNGILIALNLVAQRAARDVPYGWRYNSVTNAVALCSSLALLPESPGSETGLTFLTRLVEAIPETLTTARVTATKGLAAMTRKPELLSQIGGATWTTIVDGEPFTARLPDAHAAFTPRVRKPRKAGMFKPGERQGILNLPGLQPAPIDWRLAALVGGPSILTGDTLALLSLAHALDHPLRLDSRTGAELLARSRDGGYRRPEASDHRRYWEAAYALATLALWEPDGGYRWASLAYVQGDPKTETVTIGPPDWMRGLERGRWTLTAEGGGAAKARAIAGKYGAAGRLITGLEYRLAARFDGRPGVSPDLLPASGKAGPGRSVNIPWRECLRLMGEEWDQADRKDDDAARKRFDRMYARLESVGYKVPGPRGEAPAGDTVEIVGRRKGGNNHGGELIVRASARFVAAAKLAKKPDGKGFEPVSLIHWLGRK